MDKANPTANADEEMVLEQHPDSQVEEHLTVLEVYRQKLKNALSSNDSEKAQHALALVQSKVTLLSTIDRVPLTVFVQERLSAALVVAKSEADAANNIMELARSFSKSQPGTSSESYSRVKWTWTPVPFHGNSGEWCSWWQTFSSAIDNDILMGKEWKIKALGECLKGKANDVLGKMERTGDNYDRAIALLKDRFGDPLVLQKAYYDQLDQLAPATDLRSHRQTLDRLCAIVRNLQALADRIAVEDLTVISHICDKFSPEFLRWALDDVYKKHPDMIFEPAELLTALEGRMKIEDFMANMASQRAGRESTSSSAKPVGVLVAAAGGQKRSSEGQNKKPTTSTCVFCGKHHASADCRTYATIDTRRRKLIEAKICLNCLIPHHLAKDCRRPEATCDRCHKRHNTVFCIMGIYKKKGEISTAPPPEETAKILSQPLEYADYDIFSNHQRPIKILIGADIYFSLVNVHSSYTLASGVTMLHSFFGWIPAGGVKDSEQKSKKFCSALVTATKNIAISNIQALESDIDAHISSSSNIQSNQYILADENIIRMWSLETLGIESPEKNDKKGAEFVLDYYKRTTFVDHLNRKNVRIPWTDTKTDLPTNFRVALARLKQLVEKTPKSTLKIGDEHFRNQELEGIIEDAPPLKAKICSKNNSDEKTRLHYIPHRWLFRKDKIRVVGDFSAPTKIGISLNNLIYQGCNLTTDVVQLLLNFRLNKIALVADIEKAFLQISLNEADRDACRFLWLKDINKPVSEGNLAYKRFARLPMGLNVSPCLLNLVLADVLNEPPLNKWLLDGQKKFYVDNLITSVPSQTDALELYEAMTNRLSSVKMKLRDWATNDKTVESALPISSLDPNSGLLSALGVQWDRKNDKLFIKLDNEKPLEGTKRNVLKFLASIFDPLGLIAPCILDLKILVQKCWKNKYDWDTPLPPQLTAEWIKLRTEALRIPHIPISRQYFDNSDGGTYSLHVFCDASAKAFACCAYLVYQNKEKLISHSQLIFSKVRVAPANELTIPKLELMAVLIGNRAAIFLRKSLNISLQKTTLWTDATTILQWLQSREVLPKFVKNSISEIKQNKNIFIRYISTTDNPADCASRGQSTAQLKNNKLWWYGPSWLHHEGLWPKPPLNVENYDGSAPVIPLSVLVTTVQKSNSFLTENLEKNFRTWSNRVRVLYFVIKFCFLGGKIPFYATETEALNVAESLLVIELQNKYFKQELGLLKKGELPRNNLELFLDSKGIIRCKGRLHFSRFPWETVHPILLPRDSPAVISLIKEIHEQNAHIGVSHTLAKLREKFWISKGRAKVKSALHSCFRCRYWYGGSYPLPPIPPLPEARLTDVIPFLQIGIDYFGPLHIRHVDGEIIDVNVLLFTCLVTRAVHLELVPNLSGEQFVLALERFCSLRRVPKLIISDNAKTFTFIQPLVGIKVRIRDHKINQLITSNRIEWYFIPQYSPWFGGAYERLVALAKKCLKISYGKVLLSYMELQTIIYKIADILNGRPLSYISEEVIEPLTPNHFLKLGPTNINTSMELYSKPPLSATGSELISKWHLLCRILDSYWDAFRHLYLLSLRERHQTFHKEKKGVSKTRPQVGDVVLVEEVSMPRAYWKIGRIEKLDHRGAVAYVRCKKELLLRSIRRLYPLEVQRDSSIVSPVPPSVST